ncbi:ATP-binding protein [Paenibacillus sp. HW567]|uniref:ATP-binding protein n=1 Tax=Paenibacillus sp. HW567 TaxID=1034769 RepID=UPI0003766732|nr:ATP-binding protein [Paenibacillus sp. HW567]
MKFKKLARTFRQETPKAEYVEGEAAATLKQDSTQARNVELALGLSVEHALDQANEQAANPAAEPAPDAANASKAADSTSARSPVPDAASEAEADEAVQPYTSSHEHLAEELRRLNLQLLLQMLAKPQMDAELVLLDSEIRCLLDAEVTGEEDASLLTAKLGLLELRIAARLEASSQQGIKLPLVQLAARLNLSQLEMRCIIACLAPELDRRYERIYAFLQNDMSDMRPSVDFILQLFTQTEEERLAARLLFGADAPLMKLLLERRGEYGDSRIPLLARLLKLEDWTVNALLGYEVLDERLAKVAGLYPPELPEQTGQPDETEQSMLRFVKHYSGRMERRSGSLLYCSGPDEAGKLRSVKAVSVRLGASLLVVEMDKLLQPEADYSEMLRLLGRHTLLITTALCITGFDSIATEDDRYKLKSRMLVDMLETYAPLTFILGESEWGMSLTGYSLNFIQVDFPFPDAAARKQAWATFSQDYRLSPQISMEDLSGSFRFTSGQIRAALTGGENIAVWNGSGSGEISPKELYQACYFQSSRKIQALATKIRAAYTWDMLVLPGEQMSQLREICNQVKYRSLVYGEWGFAGRLSLGKGLNILFSGPPGSGKTMAAEVIATELNLEIYKIDVSQIVSKYIGETEKNLSRIFEEAETSNAILFFDEADALFGKRSEVKDAHDRYANVEISYLLQKMEEYTGIVILATNLNQNLDDAFARRLHFKLEFPFPEKNQRGLIWRGMFPQGAPLDPDMDYDFMADKFILAGGNIKNIALNAAFYAAHEGCPIGMKQIMLAAKREYLKLGKTFLQSDYAPYHKLIEVK